MRGEAVPERVTTRGLCDAGTPDRQFYGILKIFLTGVMTTDLI